MVCNLRLGMSQTHRSHSDLVAAILQSDGPAENELVEIFLPRIRAFVWSRTRNPELVNDLAQEVLLSSLCALRSGKLREPANLAAFVYGIARNHLNGALRKIAQERSEPLEGELPHAFHTPDYEEEARLGDAHRAIDQLEPADRRILLLTLVDGLKPAAIASAVGMNPVLVRQRKTRALKKVIDFVKNGVTNSGRTPLTGRGSPS